MVFEKIFLRLTVPASSQKKKYFKNVNFLLFFTVNKL